MVCRSAGETARKVLSDALDYNMYLVIALAAGFSIAGRNIIGADQQG